MVQKFIRGKAGGIVLTGAIIAALAYGASQLELGSRIKKAAFDTGSAGGDVITQPIAGIVSSLTSGLEDIKSKIPNFLDTTGTIGADFQEFVTGNRNAIGTFIDGTPEEKSDSRTTSRSSGRLDVSDLLTEDSVLARLVNQTKAQGSGFNNGRGTQRDTSRNGFGGFGSAAAQESELQRLIAENASKFGEFFK